MSKCLILEFAIKLLSLKGLIFNEEVNSETRNIFKVRDLGQGRCI